MHATVTDAKKVTLQKHVQRVTVADMSCGQRSFLGMMQTQEVCPTCGGIGTTITHKCKKCNGEGVVKGDEIVEVNIQVLSGKERDQISNTTERSIAIAVA